MSQACQELPGSQTPQATFPLELSEKSSGEGGKEESSSFGGGDDGVPKPRLEAELKTDKRSYTIHKSWKTSEIRVLQFSRLCPDLFKAIQKELPWAAIQWWENGLTLSWAVYVGMKRNGPSYLSKWLSENGYSSLSENALMVVEALEFYHAFTTYDALLEYLKDHNWGELRTDTSSLDSYEKSSEREEKEERKIAHSRTEYVLLTDLAASEQCLPSEFAHAGIARFNCKHCGPVSLEAYHAEKSGHLLAKCPKCRTIYRLSRSDLSEDLKN